MNLEAEMSKMRERMQAMAKELGEMRTQNRVLMLS
jgi:HAMP domain-containing protein